MARFRKTQATVFINGAFVTKSVDGPSTIEAWFQAWSLFAVSMISLGEATVGSLALYSAGMQKLIKLFPDRWDVLLTTDIVVRSEQWGQLREEFERFRPTEFNPHLPWDSVIAASSFGSSYGAMSAWWQTTFVLPNTLASSAAKATSMIRSIEGAPPGARPPAQSLRPQSLTGIGPGRASAATPPSAAQPQRAGTKWQGTLA